MSKQLWDALNTKNKDAIGQTLHDVIAEHRAVDEARERADFEEWINSFGASVERIDDDGLVTEHTGMYFYEATESGWQAWLERARRG